MGILVLFPLYDSHLPKECENEDGSSEYSEVRSDVTAYYHNFDYVDFRKHYTWNTEAKLCKMMFSTWDWDIYTHWMNWQTYEVMQILFRRCRWALHFKKRLYEKYAA